MVRWMIEPPRSRRSSDVMTKPVKSSQFEKDRERTRVAEREREREGKEALLYLYFFIL
jgi:hypothetical protein